MRVGGIRWKVWIEAALMPQLLLGPFGTDKD